MGCEWRVVGEGGDDAFGDGAGGVFLGDAQAVGRPFAPDLRLHRGDEVEQDRLGARAALQSGEEDVRGAVFVVAGDRCPEPAAKCLDTFAAGAGVVA